MHGTARKRKNAKRTEPGNTICQGSLRVPYARPIAMMVQVTSVPTLGPNGSAADYALTLLWPGDGAMIDILTRMHTKICPWRPLVGLMSLVQSSRIG